MIKNFLGRDYKQNSCKAAFTLAEVLITIGVIGVVAAMTIPTVMRNINTKVKENKISAFHKKLKQGMDLLNTQNGVGPYYTSSEDFVKNGLSKHMKIVAICDQDHLNECMGYENITLKNGTAKSVNSYKTGVDFSLISDNGNEYTSPTVGVIFGDGTPMIINYNLKCPVSDPDSRNDNSTACISGFYDINGSNPPNKRGVDVLTYNIPWGKRFSPTPLTYNECMSLKDKLGIERCCSISTCDNKDYWAGAVKTCGGIENMPTMEMLATLASQMYHIDNGDGTFSPITIEPYKQYSALEENVKTILVPGLIYNNSSGAAKSVGVSNLSDTQYFSIWSNSEYSASFARMRGFKFRETHISDDANLRYSRSIQAICLGD